MYRAIIVIVGVLTAGIATPLPATVAPTATASDTARTVDEEAADLTPAGERARIEARYRSRMARLDRLRKLAASKDDTRLQQRVDELEARTIASRAKRLSKLRQRV